MDEAERLRIEYDQCNAGYGARDKMVEEQFEKVHAFFHVFLGLALALCVVDYKAIAPLDAAVPFATLALAFFGFVPMRSMHLDLLANMSSKIALRARAAAIEAMWAGQQPPQAGGYWAVIGQRPLFAEERRHKLRQASSPEAKAAVLARPLVDPTPQFVRSSRFLLWSWFAIAAAIIGVQALVL